jgi:hypothetical protein
MVKRSNPARVHRTTVDCHLISDLWSDTRWLTARCRNSSWKDDYYSVVKEMSALYYRTRRLITMFTKPRQPWATALVYFTLKLSSRYAQSCEATSCLQVHKLKYCLHISFSCVLYVPPITFLDLFFLIVLGEEYRLWSFRRYVISFWPLLGGNSLRISVALHVLVKWKMSPSISHKKVYSVLVIYRHITKTQRTQNSFICLYVNIPVCYCILCDNYDLQDPQAWWSEDGALHRNMSL